MSAADVLLKRRRRRAAFRDCFQTPQGQEVLRDLAKFCCADESTYYEGSPHRTSYNEGARAVWLHIQQLRLANETKLVEAERLEEEERERMSQ